MPVKTFHLLAQLKQCLIGIAMLSVLSLPMPGLASSEEDLASEVEPTDYEKMSLEELLNLEVITASRGAQSLAKAPANIYVVTRQMIEDRGYRTLVEICEDLPGFDFAMYEDGGGEYTSYGSTRGIGGKPGNAKLLILIDGIQQNFVGSYWSTMWTFEQIFSDIERIEIIQGPGSAMYGAQAFAGIIHFITRNGFEGFEANLGYGAQHGDRDVNVYWGHEVNNIQITAAMRKYDTRGDGGDRYDPGQFFHDNPAPEWLAKDYRADGEFVELAVDEDGNVTTPLESPLKGSQLPDGFTTWIDSTAFRLTLATKKSKIGGYWYDIAGGSTSYLSGLDYQATQPDYMYHRRAYHVFAQNDLEFSAHATLQSNFVIRDVTQMPDTGFRYTWRFPNLAKRYDHKGQQGYIEEVLNYTFDDFHSLTTGLRVMASHKEARTISLGEVNTTGMSSTHSSWDAGNGGEGLGVYAKTPEAEVYEAAAFALFNDEWSDSFSSALGARLDYSTEFGAVLNPRLAMVYLLTEDTPIKLLYGHAFREPSQYEFWDDFRGAKLVDEDLTPERVQTVELQVATTLASMLYLQLNGYYSIIQNEIILVDDERTPSQKRFDNEDAESTKLMGGALSMNLELFNRHATLGSLKVFGNYSYTADGEGKQLEHTAQHKLNGGLNWLVWDDHINLNLRVNYVGKRLAPEDNVYIATTEDGFGPSYVKANLAITLRNIWDDNLNVKLLVRNLFDEQWYGLGRESGSSNRSVYDPTSPTAYNPPGYLPAYHPQPGRTFMVHVGVDM